MKRNDKSAGVLLNAAAVLTMLGIMLVFIMIIAFALPVFGSDSLNSQSELFSWRWQPGQGYFGILPMILGSMLLAIPSLCVAWLLALGLCCWLLSGEVGSGNRWQRRIRQVIGLLIRFMTAVPTVVYGFAAIFLLVPLIRSAITGGSGLNWLSAGLVLSLILLPTLVLVMEAGLRPRLADLHLTVAALGFSRMQALVFIVLPAAKRCLLTALILGFGRAVGDTLISLMLAGNSPQIPTALSDGLRTLTAHMALVTANEVGGAAYNSLFAAGAILLAINGGVSLILRRVRSGE